MKLYCVSTTAPEYSGFKNVVFHWFNEKPQGKRAYAVLIKDYDPKAYAIYYAEAFVDELFTEDEARQLKDYIDQSHEGETIIKEQPLPVDNNVMGYGAIPVGGMQDFYMLSKEAEYSLPFKVYGYFDLRASLEREMPKIESAASDMLPF